MTKSKEVEAAEAPPLPEVHPDMLAARLISPNEPWGSHPGNPLGGGTDPAPGEPLVLTDISPDSIVVGSAVDFVLTVTGSGFDATTVILFDDEEFAPESGDATTMSVTIPVAAAPAVVDVEVARGEDLSEVLTFEFTAVAGTRSTQKAERKPKKAEPSSKRAKKDKQKGRK
jgi:hypothetical protein